MPNTKISALTAGNPAQGTDEIPIARGAANFKVTAASIAALSPAGTVTSVAVSGGTTGLTTSGGPITASGTITLAGTLALANGGTGQTTKAAAFNALSPVTSTGDLIIGNGSNSNTRLAIGGFNEYLRSNGTTASWSSISVSAGDIAGTLQPYQGGTGTSTGPTSNGQLLIGNGFGGYNVNTLTAGTGVTITNGSGTITIAASGGGGPTISVLSLSTSSGSFNNSPPGSSTSKPLIGYTAGSPSNYGAFFFQNFNGGNYLPGGTSISSINILTSTGVSTSYTTGPDFGGSPSSFTVYDSLVTCYGLFISNTALRTLFSDSKTAITTPSFAPIDATSGFGSGNPQILLSTSGSSYNNSGGQRGITVNKAGPSYYLDFGTADTTAATPSVSSMSLTINSSMSGFLSGSDFSVISASNSSNGMFRLQITSSNATLTTILNNSFL